ncbi:hypothetical protein [Xanthomonas hortorum]|uniref:hypothetical protein n=1 Tax=Xanthomonas hortorum TaxID=56454 RepID=UPI0016055283|nr:hypothetical protein [Xanthomonas hortorum]MDT7826516.1 hypothetical protein [Xanthomonas hortorum pv. vitians]
MSKTLNLDEIKISIINGYEQSTNNSMKNIDREPGNKKEDDGILIIAVIAAGLITILASWMGIAMIVRSF